jgi:hypothetical protein
MCHGYLTIHGSMVSIDFEVLVPKENISNK